MKIDESVHGCMARAGTPAIIGSNRKDGTADEISNRGIALGMFEEEMDPYENVEFVLNNGDRVFLFSNGLTEMK